MKIESFQNIFELVRSSFTSDLLDEDSLEIMGNICARFPMDFATFWGIECRIGEMAPRGDILFEIKRGAPGHFLLTGEPINLLDTLCEKACIWSKLRGFAHNWLDNEHWSANYIRNIWLEFDSASLNKGAGIDELLKTPSLFWGPNPNKPIPYHGWTSMIEEISRFHETIAEAKLICDFISVLPESAHLFQLGMMISRSQPVLRLCINRISPEKIPDCLDRMGWQGNLTALRRYLNTFAPFFKSMAVDLDLTPDGLREKLGLECYLDTWGDCASEPWNPCFDFLVELGLCLPWKRDALLAYPRRTRMSQKRDIREKGISYPVLYQDIHHIKLTFTSGDVQEAKAYIGVHRPGINYNNICTNSPNKHIDSPHDSWLIT